jgi:hypothetical protein
MRENTKKDEEEVIKEKKPLRIDKKTQNNILKTKRKKKNHKSKLAGARENEGSVQVWGGRSSVYLPDQYSRCPTSYNLSIILL